MEEIFGPTAAQRRYEPPSSLATTLGNTQAGDGKRFKGRGPIQLTGRANYKRFGDLLGVDLVNNPERAATPEVAFRVAALFWKSKGLNELADAQNFREITRRINGGFNGLEERLKFYERAKRVLNEDTTRGMPVLSEGMAVPTDLSRGIMPGEMAAETGGAARKSSAKKSAKKRGASKKTAAKRGAAARPATARAAKKGGAKKAASKKGAKKGAAKKGGAKKGAAKKGGSKKGSSKKGGAKKGGGSKKRR
jgi:hypothetical protein